MADYRLDPMACTSNRDCVQSGTVCGSHGFCKPYVPQPPVYYSGDTQWPGQLGGGPWLPDNWRPLYAPQPPPPSLFAPTNKYSR